MTILIIQQKMIGDVLTSTILFEALRKKYPKAKLHYLINTHTVPVTENNPFIDEWVLFTPEIEKNTSKFYAFLKQIRREKYDVVIDVYGKLSSNLITLFSKAPKRIAYHKKHTSFIYTDKIQREKKPQHGAGLAVENRLKLLEPLGIHFEYFSPKIYLTPTEIEQAKRFLEQSGLDLDHPIYMIGVLGSSPKKTYPAAYMAACIDQIAKETPAAQFLFNYIPKQQEEARDIYERCAPTTQAKIHFEVFAGSLRKFMTITQHCDAFFGNEGGAANIAKALQVPTLLIFCPYINKQNWFGELELKKHGAIHLSDYIKMSASDLQKAKKEPQEYYLKLAPEYIFPQLHSFFTTLTAKPEKDN